MIVVVKNGKYYRKQATSLLTLLKWRHTLDVKYAALMEIERGVSNKDVFKKFNVPKNTLSTWKKNRDKIAAAFKSSGGTKRQRIKERTYKQVNWQLGNNSNEIATCMYSFFYFFYTTLNFYLVFCIFLGRFLTLGVKTYYTAFIVYHLSFLGKSFRWFWYYCFSHLYYTCLLGFFLSSAIKKSFKSKKMLPIEST